MDGTRGSYRPRALPPPLRQRLRPSRRHGRGGAGRPSDRTAGRTGARKSAGNPANTSDKKTRQEGNIASGIYPLPFKTAFFQYGKSAVWCFLTTLARRWATSRQRPGVPPLADLRQATPYIGRRGRTARVLFAPRFPNENAAF